MTIALSVRAKNFNLTENTMIKKNIKLIVSAIIVICIVVTCLIYTRPQTIEQRYPLLSISDCTGMKGYYFVAPGVEDTAFQISSDDSRFSELIQQLQSVQIKKKLSNILPQGTKHIGFMMVTSSGSLCCTLMMCPIQADPMAVVICFTYAISLETLVYLLTGKKFGIP